MLLNILQVVFLLFAGFNFGRHQRREKEFSATLESYLVTDISEFPEKNPAVRNQFQRFP